MLREQVLYDGNGVQVDWRQINLFGINSLLSGFSCLVFCFFLSFLSLLHVVEVRVICSGSIAFIEETALWHLCVLCKSLCPAQKIDAEMVELATSKDEFCFVTIWKQPEVQASKHLLQ